MKGHLLKRYFPYNLAEVSFFYSKHRACFSLYSTLPTSSIQHINFLEECNMLSLLMASAVVTNMEVDSHNAQSFISQGICQAIVTATEKQNQQDDSNFTDVEIKDDDPGYMMKPQAFKLYLDKELETFEPTKPEEVYISSNHDMRELVQRIYQELPQKIIIKSKYFTTSQLKSMYEVSESQLVADNNPNTKGLANYSIKQMGRNLQITDNANDFYPSYVIKKASDALVKDLVPTLKGAHELETINNVYDWMYNNFEYAADSYKNMLVGNMYTGKLACNGFSYLADALFEEAGIKSTIRSGTSHFWNVLTLEDGREATFDVTTDIVLDHYKKTLGTSTKEHIAAASGIGFFSAEFIPGYYHEVQSYDELKVQGE